MAIKHHTSAVRWDERDWKIVLKAIAKLNRKGKGPTVSQARFIRHYVLRAARQLIKGDKEN